MSNLQRLLEIIISVKDEGLGRLSAAQRATKELLTAEERLQRARGDFQARLAAIDAKEKEFVATLENEKRRTLELLNTQRARTQALNEQQNTIRSAVLQEAELARRRGQLAQSEALLLRAMEMTNAESAEAFRIKQRLVQLDQERARSAVQSTRAIIQQAVAEAQVLRNKGNLVGAEQKLQQALALTNAESVEAARIRRQLLQIDAQRGRQADAARQNIVRLAMAEANLARTTGRTGDEIDILRRAMNIANLTSLERVGIQNRLAAAEKRLATEMQRSSMAAREHGMILSALGASARTVRAAYGQFTRILASFVLIGFSLRSAFRMFDRLVVAPVRDTAKYALETTDNFRRLEASLLGVVGSMRAVRDLTVDVQRASETLPVTYQEALGAVRGLAFIPSTASMIQTPGEQRPDQVRDLLNILTGLATIDPDQGLEGARFAMREALAGEFRSLRFRFEISPQVVASTVGANLEDLKADPALTIEAMREFVNLFVGEEAIQEFSNLLSVQGNLLRGSMEEFFGLVGDSGFYDSAVERLRNANQQIRAAIRTGALDDVAEILSEQLSATLDDVLGVGGQLIERFTGVPVDLTNLDESQIRAGALAFSEIIQQLSTLMLLVISLGPEFAGAAARVTVFLGRLFGADIPSTDPEVLRQQIVDLRQRRIGGVEAGGSTLGRLLLGQPAPGQAISDEDLRALDAQIARYSDLLSILTGGGRRGPRIAPTEQERFISDVEGLTAGVGETGKSLGQLAGRLDQVLGELGDAGRLRLLEESATALTNSLRAIYGDGADSVPAVLAAADEELKRNNEAIQRLFQEHGEIPIDSDLFASLLQLDENVRTIVGQRAATIHALNRSLEARTAEILRASVGDLDELPTGSQLRTALDILDTIAGLSGTRTRPTLGAGALDVAGAVPGPAYDRLFDLTRAMADRGADLGQVFDPDMLRTVADLIDVIGQGIIDRTDNLELANETVQSMVEQFRSLGEERAGVAPTPEERDRWNTFLGFLDDVADRYDGLFRQMQQEELERRISDMLREETDRLRAAGESLRAVQQELEEQDRVAREQAFGGFDRLGRAAIPSTARAAFTGSIDALVDPGGSFQAFRRQLNEEIAAIGLELDAAIAQMEEARTPVEGMTPEQVASRARAFQERVSGLEGALADMLERRDALIQDAEDAVQEGFRDILGGAGRIQMLPDQMRAGEVERIVQMLEERSGLIGQLRGAGLAPMDLGPEPDDIGAIVELLGVYNESLRDVGVNSQTAQDHTEALGERMIGVFEGLRDTAPESMREAYDEVIAIIRDSMEEVDELHAMVEESVRQTATSISSTLRAGLGDTLQASLQGNFESIEDVARSTLNAIQRQLIDLALQAFIFQGGLGMNNRILGLFGIPSDRGNIFSGREIIQNQMGGLIDRFMAVPGPGNRVFTAGETAPEIVAPAERDLDGRLGIRVVGGGGGGSTNVNVRMQISTPDVRGFERSASQVARTLSEQLDRAMRRR